MDYPVLGEAPDVAIATVPHSLDTNGNAVPASAANPTPVSITGTATISGAVTGTGTAGAPPSGVLAVQAPEDGSTLTKASVTMTGSSATLVSADPTRKVVLVSNTDTNGAAAIDPSGGTAALDAGIPLLGGATLKITGKAAQAAMTQIGTNTQKLTVYTG